MSDPDAARAASFPALSPILREQLEQIEPSRDGRILVPERVPFCAYYPCRVQLRDGSWRDFVYLVEASEYFRLWGTWPDNDPGKAEVFLEEVVAFEESRRRLPAHLANRLYEQGESGMGYHLFTVVLGDGRRLPRITGGAVDFPELPDGVSTSDIADVSSDVGDFYRKTPVTSGSGNEPYGWCIFSS